jgi:hypothetical protein
MSYSIVKEQSPLSRRKAKKQKVMIREDGEGVKEERGGIHRGKCYWASSKQAGGIRDL